MTYDTQVETVGRLLADGDPLAVLERYYRHYTGSHFETMGRSSADDWLDPSPNRLTIEDVLAPALLSVPIPPLTMVALLEMNTGDLPDLLNEIPVDVDLSDALPAERPWEGYWRACADVWNRLIVIDEIGPTSASKLLSRKRPRLLPVIDSRVRDLLEIGRHDNEWSIIQAVASAHAEALRSILKEVHRAPWGDTRVFALTPLRLLDVLIWMEAAEPSK
jgi:hypothetical protein